VSHVDWADFPRAAEIVGVGRIAAEKALPGLTAAIAAASTWKRRFRRHSDRALRRLGLVDTRRPAVLAIEAVAPTPPADEDE